VEPETKLTKESLQNIGSANSFGEREEEPTLRSNDLRREMLARIQRVQAARMKTKGKKFKGIRRRR